MLTNETIMYAWDNLYKTFLIGFVMSLVFGIWLIPFLKDLKCGQKIREEGPKNHKKKAGTPTMGGLIFLVAFFLSIFVSVKQLSAEIIFILVATFGFATIGFIDDYIKIVRKRNLGLRAYQKFIIQLAFSVVLAYWAGKIFGLMMYIPLVKQPVYMGNWYYVIIVIAALGTANGANLTDGLDGLATGVSGFIILTFSIIANIAGYHGVYMVGMAMVGALGGFLHNNWNPADVFMGDVGSLSLGGIIWALSVALHMPIFLLIIGATFVVESLSVIIQVSSYKLTKKRVFKMSPLHHHFELSGKSEVGIVYGFYIFTVLACYIGYTVSKVIVWIPFVD